MTAMHALDRTILLSRDFIGDNTVTDQEILDQLLATQVCLVADEANLNSASGQAALITFASLTMMLGAHLRFVFPETEVRGAQPPLRGRLLRQGLLDLASDLIPGVTAEADEWNAPDELVFVFGDTPWFGQARASWRVAGSAWSGGTAPVSATVNCWQGDFPLGGLAAASVAAVEPYKDAIRRLQARLPIPVNNRDQVAAVPAATVYLAPDGTPSPTLDFRRLDLISGGAITNAVLHVLLRLPGARADVRVIEPERLDLTNLNRYSLARSSDIPNWKTEALSQWQTPQFAIRGVPLRFEEDTLQLILPLADQVIVGTDDIPSRWLIQQHWPKWLGVGATAHFLTLTSEHYGQLPCVGCLHPKDDGINATIPTVSFVSYWAGLLTATRLVRHVLGVRYTAQEQALNLWPLQLDGRHALWWQPIPRLPTCPVHCSQPTV